MARTLTVKAGNAAEAHEIAADHMVGHPLYAGLQIAGPAERTDTFDPSYGRDENDEYRVHLWRVPLEPEMSAEEASTLAGIEATYPGETEREEAEASRYDSIGGVYPPRPHDPMCGLEGALCSDCRDAEWDPAAEEPAYRAIPSDPAEEPDPWADLSALEYR